MTTRPASHSYHDSFRHSHETVPPAEYHYQAITPCKGDSLIVIAKAERNGETGGEKRAMNRPRDVHLVGRPGRRQTVIGTRRGTPVERASSADRAYFQRHPGARTYLREYVPGEFGPV